jgi:hypothetical protein
MPGLIERNHVRVECPGKEQGLCSFVFLASGAMGDTKVEEVIEVAEAVAKIHFRHEHPGANPPTFRLEWGQDEAQTVTDPSKVN